jgi:hypothetical protein
MNKCAWTTVELWCRVKLKYFKKNLGNATLPTTNPTRTGLGLKLCLQRGWWLTTYGSAWPYFTLHVFTRKHSLSTVCLTLWLNVVVSRKWGNRHGLSAIQMFLCEVLLPQYFNISLTFLHVGSFITHILLCFVIFVIYCIFKKCCSVKIFQKLY